jgi:hypothetical protein
MLRHLRTLLVLCRNTIWQTGLPLESTIAIGHLHCLAYIAGVGTLLESVRDVIRVVFEND